MSYAWKKQSTSKKKTAWIFFGNTLSFSRLYGTDNDAQVALFNAYTPNEDIKWKAFCLPYMLPLFHFDNFYFYFFRLSLSPSFHFSCRIEWVTNLYGTQIKNKINLEYKQKFSHSKEHTTHIHSYIYIDWNNITFYFCYDLFFHIYFLICFFVNRKMAIRFLSFFCNRRKKNSCDESMPFCYSTFHKTWFQLCDCANWRQIVFFQFLSQKTLYYNFVEIIFYDPYNCHTLTMNGHLQSQTHGKNSYMLT